MQGSITQSYNVLDDQQNDLTKMAREIYYAYQVKEESKEEIEQSEDQQNPPLRRQDNMRLSMSRRKSFIRAKGTKEQQK